MKILAFFLFVFLVLSLALLSACASTTPNAASTERQVVESKLCAGIAKARVLERDFDALPAPGSARAVVEAEEDALCANVPAVVVASTADAGK